jgi:OOP family OmpA-OmpF porin
MFVANLKLKIMKKFLLAITLVSAFTTISAQTESEKATDAVSESGYNRWSFELNGGVNKPQKPFTSGYFTATPSPFNVDFGVRYMFNNKFGLKADVGYYNFENKDTSL